MSIIEPLPPKLSINLRSPKVKQVNRLQQTFSTKLVLSRMAYEKDIVASILKLTAKGPVQKELVRKDARVKAQLLDETLRKFSENGLLRQRHDLVETSPSQRVNMAVQAIQLGADLEQVCKFLEWTEFEGMAAQAFQANRFRVLKNFRFKQAGRRWEIDVLGCKEPLVVCVDCKHWQRHWSAATLVKVVEAQVERTRAFADSLPNYYQKVGLAEWKTAKLIPLVLSLVSGPFKFHSNVPIVPVFQLQDFINGLPLEADSLTHFRKEPVKFEQKLTDYSK